MNNYPPHDGTQPQAQYGAAPPLGYQVNQPGQVPLGGSTQGVSGYPGAPASPPMQGGVPLGYAPAGYGAPANPPYVQQPGAPVAPPVPMPSIPMGSPFQQTLGQIPQPPSMMPSYPTDNSSQLAMQNPRTAGLVGSPSSMIPPPAAPGYPQPQQPQQMYQQQGQQQQYYQQSGYGGKQMSMPVPIIGQPAPLNLLESIADSPTITVHLVPLVICSHSFSLLITLHFLDVP